MCTFLNLFCEITISNWISIAAIFLGPFVGLQLSSWLTRKKEKRNRKIEAFSTLMSLRHVTPTPEPVQKVFRLMEVVFYEDDKVLGAWRKLSNTLNAIPFNVDQANTEYESLLVTMAKSLGYDKITGSDIQKRYLPTSTENSQV